jgi:hypothetical protein
MPKKKHQKAKDRNRESDPYRQIEEFFSFADPACYRKYILSMLKAAYSEGYWKKSFPGELLIFHEQIKSLVKAVHQLAPGGKPTGKKAARAILDDDAFLNGINLTAYTGFNRENEIWEVFPRHLTKKEFVNPWLVFKKFLKYKSRSEWESDLENIVSYALSPHGKESALEYDYLSINIQLQKLVEAAHLIRMRTNNYLPDKNSATE